MRIPRKAVPETGSQLHHLSKITLMLGKAIINGSL